MQKKRAENILAGKHIAGSKQIGGIYMEIENLTNLAKLCTGFMIFLQQSWAVAVKTLFWLSNKRDLFY